MMHTAYRRGGRDCTGLGKGGQQTQSCRKAYIQAVDLLVKLANLQTAFITLDMALKTTNRRVNALENVVKPRLANTISYIIVRTFPTAPSCPVLLFYSIVGSSANALYLCLRSSACCPPAAALLCANHFRCG